MRKPVVLITGAGGEIGHGLVTRLSAAGLPIITIDVSPLDPALAPLVTREFTGSITDNSLLGMNPTAAFPIMMGSCAFLMPISTVQFAKSRTYHVQAALGLALGGLPGVLIAAGVFWSLSLVAVRWLVVVVVYTSLNMLLTARDTHA